MIIKILAASPAAGIALSLCLWLWDVAEKGNYSQAMIYSAGLIFSAGLLTNEIRSMKKSMVTQEGLNAAILTLKLDISEKYQTKEECQDKTHAASAGS